MNNSKSNPRVSRREAKERIEKLRKVIHHHRYLYHVLDRPEISDAAWDSLKHELAELEAMYPDLLTPDSPTQRVGGTPLAKFEKVIHRAPMLSLNDAFSEKEVREWEERLKKLLGPGARPTYFCELKMDGLAVSLEYHGGLLVRGSTRGDGKVGEDVTQNLRTIEAIPLQLEIDRVTKRLKEKVLGDVEIRGEVFMSKEAFTRLNDRQQKAGEQLFANPRNAAAGSVRQLDSKITRARRLDFFAYDFLGNFGQQQHEESHAYAQQLGCPINPYSKQCATLNEVFAFFAHIEKIRTKLPYQIDGIVINVNNLDLFQKAGVIGKAPRGALAYKFPAEQATTIIEDIKVQVGRTGVLTPVAHFQPVLVAGSTVGRATLHNADEIKRLGVRIGDTVVIQKAGDVIPDVVRVVTDLRTGKERSFCMPKRCPVCGRLVAHPDGEVAYYCTNQRCPARHLEELYHFVGKKAFDIEGLGPKILDQLVAEGLVRQPADLFSLTASDVEPLEMFAEKKAEKLITAIQEKKRQPLTRFIYALGIRHVGEETANSLATHFGSLDRLLDASRDELQTIPDIGPVVAESVAKFFTDSGSREKVLRLRRQGVEVTGAPRQASRQLAGKSFVVTGTLSSLSREEAHERIRANGGNVSSSVSKNTNYLVAGEAPGSKLAKAEKLGIPVLDEAGFLRLLGEKR